MRFLSAFCCFVSLLVPSMAHAQPAAPLPQAAAPDSNVNEPGKPGSAATMATIEQRMQTIDELESRGVLTADQANSQRQFYLDQAAKVAGRQITRHELSTWQEREGFFTFLNVCLVLAAILGVVALGLILGPILLRIPEPAWQVILYVLCAFLIFGTSTLWTVLPGCLGLVGAAALTMHLYFKESKHWGTVISAICFAVWTAAAIYHGSAVIGFIAIMALESLLGFSILVGPLCMFIGFEDEDVIPRATIASLVLLVGGVILRSVLLLPSGAIRPEMLNLATTLAPFQTGLIFVGTFVYFTGLLIMSSKWYVFADDKKTASLYILLQVATVISGVASVYFGFLMGIGLLTGIAGTYFGIYILQKYIELPWDTIGYKLGLLGLAGLLYAFVYFAQSHPEYFLFGF